MGKAAAALALIWSAASVAGVLWLVLKPVFILKPGSSSTWPNGLRFSYCWAPVLGVLGAMACQSISPQDVLQGLRGDERMQPFGILILFMSLAYIAAALDATGCFAWLALKITAASKGRGHLLFFYYYALASIMTAFTSNDVSIMTLTPIINYFASATNSDPVPYLVAEFAAANVWGMLLFIGNPTNIIVAQAYQMSFIGYSKWMAAPTLVAGTAAVCQLYSSMRQRLPRHVTLPDVDASTIVKDRVSCWFGSLNLGICLLLLVLAPALHLNMWLVTLVCALVQLAYQAVVAVAVDPDTGRWLEWKTIMSFKPNMGGLWQPRKYAPSTADEVEADAILGRGLSICSTKAQQGVVRPPSPTLRSLISTLSQRMHTRQPSTTSAQADGEFSPVLVGSAGQVGPAGSGMPRASSGLVRWGSGGGAGPQALSRSKSWGHGLNSFRSQGAAGARQLLRLTSGAQLPSAQHQTNLDCIARVAQLDGGSPRAGYGPGGGSAGYGPGGGSGPASPRMMPLPAMPESPSSSEDSRSRTGQLHVLTCTAAVSSAPDTPRAAHPGQPAPGLTWCVRQGSLNSPRRAQGPSGLHRTTLLPASHSTARLLDGDGSSQCHTPSEDSMHLTQPHLEAACGVSDGGGRSCSAAGALNTWADGNTADQGQQQPQLPWHTTAINWFRSQSIGANKHNASEGVGSREQGSRAAGASEPTRSTDAAGAVITAFASHSESQVSYASPEPLPLGHVTPANQRLASVGSDMGLGSSHTQCDIQMVSMTAGLRHPDHQYDALPQIDNAPSPPPDCKHGGADSASTNTTAHQPPAATWQLPTQPAGSPPGPYLGLPRPDSSPGGESTALLHRHAGVCRNAAAARGVSFQGAGSGPQGGDDVEAQAQGPGQAVLQHPLQQLISRQTGFWSILLHLPWEVVPFVLGMFVLVEGLKTQGWVELMARGLGTACGKGGLAATLFIMGLLSAVAANVVNNQPMTILFTTLCLDDQFRHALLTHAAPGDPGAADRLTQAALFAVVVGSNVGALYTLIGALAGIMWKNIASRMGVEIGYVQFSRLLLPVGLTTTLISILILYAEFSV